MPQDEVAEAAGPARLLTSAAGSHMTGQFLVVDGGLAVRSLTQDSYMRRCPFITAA